MHKQTDIKLARLKLINSIKPFKYNKSTSIDEFLDKAAQYAKTTNVIVVFDTYLLDSMLLVELASKLRQICSLYNSLLFINDRLDIFKIVDADGLVLNNRSYDLKQVKKFVSDEKYIAYLVSENEDIKNINDFDFIIAGNLYSIEASKDKYRIFKMEK